MRRDDLYVADIYKAAAAIELFLRDISQETFLLEKSDLIQSAVLQKLTIVGEAAARISDDLKTQSPDIPWRHIIGLRNIAVHAYFSIDWQIVWAAAEDDVPELVTKLSTIRIFDES